MAEYFKTEDDKMKNTYILPTSTLLEQLQMDHKSCILELMSECFNYSLTDFFRYLINTYDVKIYVENTYPYFSIYFTHLQDGVEFCKELNSRYQNYLINKDL